MFAQVSKFSYLLINLLAISYFFISGSPSYEADYFVEMKLLVIHKVQINMCWQILIHICASASLHFQHIDLGQLCTTATVLVSYTTYIHSCSQFLFNIKTL